MKVMVMVIIVLSMMILMMHPLGVYKRMLMLFELDASRVDVLCASILGAEQLLCMYCGNVCGWASDRS